MALYQTCFSSPRLSTAFPCFLASMFTLFSSRKRPLDTPPHLKEVLSSHPSPYRFFFFPTLGCLLYFQSFWLVNVSGSNPDSSKEICSLSSGLAPIPCLCAHCWVSKADSFWNLEPFLLSLFASFIIVVIFESLTSMFIVLTPRLSPNQRLFPHPSVTTLLPSPSYVLVMCLS